MVMEFLAGLSLAMMVRRGAERLPSGRLPAPLVVNMIAQACAGLHYAHERVVNGKPLNIVHRDISPQNLVVSFEGVVKVVDFGIAKAELRETRTQSGTIKGKFAYMSPEQCIATNVDRRTDVFALGVILHELLTGRRLFKKPSPYETYQAVIECAVEPPSRIDPTLDPALDPIVMRAVAKTKEQRYATAEELGDTLLGYMHQRGISSGPGDVGRCFEASFGQDIEEHGGRMRELIAGRVAADPSATWGEGEEDGKPQEVSAAGAAQGSIDPDLPASSSLSGVIGQLAAAGGEGGDAGEGGEVPSERTRIETNPLERVNELDAEHARSKQMQAEKTPPPVMQPPQAQAVPPQAQAQAAPPSAQAPRQTAPTPRPMPSIPSGPLATSPGTTLPGPRASATPAPLLRPASGKFPEAANLPTMIARPDQGGDDDDDDEPELAKTELGAPVYPAGSDPNAMTVLEMAAPDLDQVRASMGLPPQPKAGSPQPGTPGAAGLQPQGPEGAPMDAGSPTPMAPPRQQPQNMPIGPAGYPVMDAQMRDQMASGATVFPSGREPHRPPDLQRPNEPHRPMDPGHPMGQHPMGQHPMGQYPMGQHPMTSDWPAGPTAPGAPKRAMPPWMLAVLFIGVVGGALLITILIAQAMR
jgi:serine/threonine-protein kinase